MYKLTISLVLLVLVAIIGVGWSVDRLFERFVDSGSSQLDVYRGLGRETANFIATALPESTPEAKIATMRFSGEHVELKLIDRDTLELPTVLNQDLASSEGLLLESDMGVALYFGVPGSDSVLEMRLLLLPKPDDRHRWLLTTLFYVAVVLLVLLWLYPLLRRLQRLADSARAFGHGKLEQRVATSSKSQLYIIESEFNRMAARIENLVSDNKLLGSAVSHDLRTPLARLRFGIDAVIELDDIPNAEQQRRPWLVRLQSDVDAMENLVNVLLDYTRLERHLHELPRERVYLSELVVPCIAARVRTGILIDWLPAQSDDTVLAHERTINMLINNLLDNARIHGGGAILVRLESDDRTVRLSVEDNGQGIPPARRDQVLQPFVHGEEETAGHGLGLAIVARIAAWHQAKLSIDESPNLGGARLMVAFQRLPQSGESDSKVGV